MKQFETKAAHLVDGADVLTDECAKKLGVRDTETAVEDFVNSNTQVYNTLLVYRFILVQLSDVLSDVKARATHGTYS